MAWEEDCDGSMEDVFVPVVFARSIEEAEEYLQLLEDHGIEAVPGSEGDPPEVSDPDTTVGTIAHGVPVLVPEMFLDEASEIIADREDTDEFEPDDEEDDDEEDDEEEFSLGGEDGKDGFFQLEEESDVPHDIEEDDETKEFGLEDKDEEDEYF